MAISDKTKEPEERGSRARAALLTAAGQRDQAYVIALVEATRERRLAALRISELSRQAVDRLLHSA